MPEDRDADVEVGGTFLCIDHGGYGAKAAAGYLEAAQRERLPLARATESPAGGVAHRAAIVQQVEALGERAPDEHLGAVAEIERGLNGRAVLDTHAEGLDAPLRGEREP